jgi:hypothetical protein
MESVTPPDRLTGTSVGADHQHEERTVGRRREAGLVHPVDLEKSLTDDRVQPSQGDGRRQTQAEEDRDEDRGQDGQDPPLHERPVVAVCSPVSLLTRIS